MAIKIDAEALRNLSDITKDGVVGKHAFRVLLYIISVMDADNKAKIDQQKLAARIAVSGQTLYMATKALCGYGFIAKAKTGTRSKTFIVNPALAMTDASGADERYETIMEAFTEAQAADIVTPEIAVETPAEVEVPAFVGIPEGSEA